MILFLSVPVKCNFAIEELPPTSDMKMIDIWLIFCLVVPFLEVILRTGIECLNCSCSTCERKDAYNSQLARMRNTEKHGEGAGWVQGVSPSVESTSVRVRTAKVASEQVLCDIFKSFRPRVTPSIRFWLKTKMRRSQDWLKTVARQRRILRPEVSKGLVLGHLFAEEESWREDWNIPVSVLWYAYFIERKSMITKKISGQI